jgi:glycosyltransferase involved in cell wall biosynthesis
MPGVSVLIPAFRPQYLDLAIASSMAQSYTDFELLISDDSNDEAVASVVSKWNDPRLRYLKNPNRQAPGANRDHLLGLAQGKYIKFLFDDDFLLPQSIEVLVTVAEQTGSHMVFHGRHFVDAQGRTLASPLPVPAGKIEPLSRRGFFERTVGSVANFIGEPTNILFEAQAFRRLERPFAVAGFPMRFLTDVSLYINFVAQGYQVTGIGVMGSAFRQHDQQTSSAKFPAFSAGLFEWELFLRWATDQGDVDPGRFAAALTHLHRIYRQHVDQFPELAPLLELGGRPGSGGYLSEEFRELASLAYMSIDLRRLAHTRNRMLS